MDLEMMRQVAWLGDEFVEGDIRGVVLVFHGLGYNAMKSGPELEEYAWAQAGGLVVFPYYGPWSWMNRQARALVDDLVDSVYAHFQLTDELPLIATGGSMGGYSALLYTRYARRPVTGCLANYPACDLAYHFGERPDLPRTIYHAFSGYREPLAELLLEHSPLAQAASMPDIPYLFIHGDADRAVSKEQHSDRMVAALRQRGLNVSYLEVPGMGHGGPVPKGVIGQRIAFVTDLICGGD